MNFLCRQACVERVRLVPSSRVVWPKHEMTEWQVSGTLKEVLTGRAAVDQHDVYRDETATMEGDGSGARAAAPTGAEEGYGGRRTRRRTGRRWPGGRTMILLISAEHPV